MNTPTKRLLTQHQRLFSHLHGPEADGQLRAAEAGDMRGVRALVLGLAQPADWSVLGAVWRGVQADLDLPAPGIAVNGEDALALWFSIAEPVPVDQATAFLAALCRRYLADVKPARLRLLPPHPGMAQPGEDTLRIPPHPTGADRWAAFVAPDLAAVFADEPVLDLAPGEDAQAELLGRLRSMTPAAFQAALQQLGGSGAAASSAEPAPSGTLVRSALAEPASTMAPSSLGGPFQDPRTFLLAVMNNAGVPLSQRIKAARALLAGEASR